MLRDFEDELLATIVRLEGVQNGWKLVSIEFNVNNGTDNLMDLAMKGAVTGESSTGNSSS
jgi:hypothetical protein